mgnify:CR=1 FL=1
MDYPARELWSRGAMPLMHEAAARESSPPLLAFADVPLARCLGTVMSHLMHLAIARAVWVAPLNRRFCKDLLQVGTAGFEPATP